MTIYRDAREVNTEHMKSAAISRIASSPRPRHDDVSITFAFELMPPFTRLTSRSRIVMNDILAIVGERRVRDADILCYYSLDEMMAAISAISISMMMGHLIHMRLQHITFHL